MIRTRRDNTQAVRVVIRLVTNLGVKI